MLALGRSPHPLPQSRRLPRPLPSTTSRSTPALPTLALTHPHPHRRPKPKHHLRSHAGRTGSGGIGRDRDRDRDSTGSAGSVGSTGSVGSVGGGGRSSFGTSGLGRSVRRPGSTPRSRSDSLAAIPGTEFAHAFAASKQSRDQVGGCGVCFQRLPSASIDFH